MQYLVHIVNGVIWVLKYVRMYLYYSLFFSRMRSTALGRDGHRQHTMWPDLKKNIIWKMATLSCCLKCANKSRWLDISMKQIEHLNRRLLWTSSKWWRILQRSSNLAWQIWHSSPFTLGGNLSSFSSSNWMREQSLSWSRLCLLASTPPRLMTKQEEHM